MNEKNESFLFLILNNSHQLCLSLRKFSYFSYKAQNILNNINEMKY
jgi:hypothetical protein